MGLLKRLKSAFFKERLDVSSRYELLREAIYGTMSRFYMARDRQTGEIVGLKILDPKKTAAFESRFKGLTKPTEGEISSRLKHAYIVATFQHGITTEGAQYLVMEYLGGGGMNSLLAGQDPRLDGRRVRFIRQIAEALQAVHAAGFLHRDVCPRNILLTSDGETAKLTDFGLSVPATKPFFRPGNRTGTANYMAPELVRRFPTDHRVDVFAFGVTAYEICTTELPWPRGTTGMAAMAHDQPPTDIRRHRPQIDARLAQAIHACIEPDLTKRCSSMAQFLRWIRGLDHEDGG